MVVSLMGDAGTRAIGAATDTSPPTPLPQLTNISTRALVETGDNVIIGGFIVQGSATKRVIIRALGPELTQMALRMHCVIRPWSYTTGGALIASNNNWGTTIIGGIITQNQVRDIMNSGHAPTNGLESAIIADPPPGNYTAIVRGVNDTTGVGLVECTISTLILLLLQVYATSAVAVLF